MKLTPSFVLALAAASSGLASPVVKRQMSSESLPTPVASGIGPVSSRLSSATSRASAATGSSSSSASAATQTGTSGPGGAGAGSGSGSGSMTFNDTQILQYALTLEHLEATFYNQSLGMLSTQDFEDAGYNASVRNQIYSIGRDEAAHVDLLSKALGNESIPACTYNFSGVTDVESFLTTARVLEGVGVSAYLGAAQNITSKSYLEVAASILTVEGRHASFLTAQTDDGGNAIPSPFDTPLDFKQVYSLAAPFISSCPNNASLGISAFPTLTLSGGAANGSFTPGQQVSVSYDNSTMSSNNSSMMAKRDGGNNSTYLAIIQGIAGPQFLPLDGGSNSSVTLPSNLTGGQMYAVVTSSNTAVTDDNTLAGPAVGFVNIPLPEAPEATGSMSGASSSSSSSSGASASSTMTGSMDGGAGGAGAGPTGSPTSMMSGSAQPTGSASGTDSVISTDTSAATTTNGGMMSSMSQSIGASIASQASANIPTPSASA